MKYLPAILVFAMIGCKKNISTISGAGFKGTVTVIKDCTGSYLRYNSLDYNVCNREKLDKYENGTVITTVVNKIENCNNYPYMVCYMAHGNEGWVEVVSIK